MSEKYSNWLAFRMKHGLPTWGYHWTHDDEVYDEYCDLKEIATKARRNDDRRTLIMVGECIDEFYSRHSEYLYTCHSSSMTRELYNIK